MEKLIKSLFSFFLSHLLIASLNSMENNDIRECKSFNIENAKSKEDFEDWIKAEEAKLWDKFYKIYEITRAQFQNTKELNQDEYEAVSNEIVQNNSIVSLELNEDLKDLIDEVYDDFGLGKDIFQIVPFSKPQFASSTDNVLFINQSLLLANIPKGFKKYSIALAISMAIKQDHSTDYHLAMIREIKGLQKTRDLIHAMINYRILKTIRSDLHVLLLGKEYRDAHNHYFTSFMNQSDYKPNGEDRARMIIGELMAKALDKP